MNFLKPDTTYTEIILRLAEENSLTRREIARVLEPNFPYIPRPDKLMYVLSEVDRCIDRLEKSGMAKKFRYKGKLKDYTVQITEKGLEYAERLRCEKNESS
jgi:DNA-binding PadR family transcriptional regulator